MQYILDTMKKLLACDSPTGFTGNAAQLMLDEFRSLGIPARLTRKGCVLADLGGEGNPLVISAHIDTLGCMVAEVKSNGRLRLAKLGGLHPNSVEGESCRIYTRFGKVYSGTMQLLNASIHVNNKFSDTKRDYDTMEVLIDEATASREETEALGISAGDIVCFDTRTIITESGYIKSRFLDDKLSAAILLGIAKEVADSTLQLKRKVTLSFTTYEEVGHGGSAVLPEDTEELLCVDMGCIGDGLTCDEKKVSICAKDAHGPYDYDMTTALIRLAKEHGLDYAVDLYPFYGSDAGAALAAGADVRYALIGPGVYASHGYERSHVQGAENTYRLIRAYLEA